MAVSCLLLLSTVLYFLVFLCNLVVTITLAVATSDEKGHCMLFINTVGVPPSSQVCTFCLYIPVGTGIYAFAMGVYNGYAVLVAFREAHIARQMWVMPYMLLNSLVFLITMGAAIAFTVGFTVSCQTYGKESGGCQFQFDNRFGNGLNAYYKFNVIQTAFWVSFLLWMAIFGVTVIRFMRNRRARSTNPFLPFDTSADTQPISTFPPTA